jgi:hypothetical protein
MNKVALIGPRVLVRVKCSQPAKLKHQVSSFSRDSNPEPDGRRGKSYQPPCDVFAVPICAIQVTSFTILRLRSAHTAILIHIHATPQMPSHASEGDGGAGELLYWELVLYYLGFSGNPHITCSVWILECGMLRSARILGCWKSC